MKIGVCVKFWIDGEKVYRRVCVFIRRARLNRRERDGGEVYG